MEPIDYLLKNSDWLKNPLSGQSSQAASCSEAKLSPSS